VIQTERKTTTTHARRLLQASNDDGRAFRVKGIPARGNTCVRARSRSSQQLSGRVADVVGHTSVGKMSSSYEDRRLTRPTVVVEADRLGDEEDLSRAQELEPWEAVELTASDAAVLAARCLILLLFLVAIGMVTNLLCFPMQCLTTLF